MPRKFVMDGDEDELSNDVFPMIEALPCGDDWTILEGAPSTDLHRKIMSVPLVDGDQAHNLRMHEVGHAQWTPRKLSGAINASRDCLEAVEDMRINLRLAGCGVDLKKGYVPESLLTNFLDHHITS